MMGSFTAIPNSVYEMAPEIGPAAVLVYLHLSYRRGKDNTCWPGYDEIREYTGLGRNTISDAIKALCEAGLITKHRRFGNSTVYELIYNVSPVVPHSTNEDIKDTPVVPHSTPVVPHSTPVVPTAYANKTQLTRLNEQDVDTPNHLKLSDAFTQFAHMAYFGNDTTWLEACEDMAKAGIQEADIEAAVKHCLDNGYTIRGPQSIMKSANIEMSKRFNGVNGNGHKKETIPSEVY